MDPYIIINLVMQELERRGIKSHYGPTANFREAAKHAAAMLTAMDAPIVELETE